MTTLPPSWIDDLVIYELNPRGFTSPRGAGSGSGSGTFESLRARLPYLRELGVTAIWLAGFCEATDHFYGIWSVYATRRPDRLDPALGGEAEFRALVDGAHEHGIRLFLDVVSHGVVADSPLVAEHPDWFDGGTWGMRDYDYAHPAFRDWWVGVWTDYVQRYGVDGFRVDVALGDKALWDRITENAARGGTPIVVFGEAEPYHFQQLSHHFEHGHEWDPAAAQSHSERSARARPSVCTDLVTEYQRTDERYSSAEISCHDAGWKCGPGNFYVVRGSRFRFGYGAAFAPQIPIFFAGEEFDAEQLSLPSLRRGLYGDGGPGGWLYGTQVPWEGLDETSGATMLADARRMLRIRRENRDLLNADRRTGPVIRVAGELGDGPVPYARFVPGEKAIVVVGNDATTPVRRRLAVPLRELGLAGAGPYSVTELMTGRATTSDEAGLAAFDVAVPADGGPGGGVRAFRIEPA